MKLSLSEMLNENFSANNIDKLLREAEKENSQEDAFFSLIAIKSITSVLIPPEDFSETVQSFLRGKDVMMSRYPKRVTALRSNEKDDKKELADKEKNLSDDKRISRADSTYDISYADLVQLEKMLITSFNQVTARGKDDFQAGFLNQVQAKPIILKSLNLKFNFVNKLEDKAKSSPVDANIYNQLGLAPLTIIATVDNEDYYLSNGGNLIVWLLPTNITYSKEQFELLDKYYNITKKDNNEKNTAQKQNESFIHESTLTQLLFENIGEVEGFFRSLGSRTFNKNAKLVNKSKNTIIDVRASSDEFGIQNYFQGSEIQFGKFQIGDKTVYIETNTVSNNIEIIDTSSKDFREKLNKEELYFRDDWQRIEDDLAEALFEKLFRKGLIFTFAKVFTKDSLISMIKLKIKKEPSIVFILTAYNRINLYAYYDYVNKKVKFAYNNNNDINIDDLDLDLSHDCELFYNNTQHEGPIVIYDGEEIDDLIQRATSDIDVKHSSLHHASKVAFVKTEKSFTDIFNANKEALSKNNNLGLVFFQESANEMSEYISFYYASDVNKYAFYSKKLSRRHSFIPEEHLDNIYENIVKEMQFVVLYDSVNKIYTKIKQNVASGGDSSSDPGDGSGGDSSSDSGSDAGGDAGKESPQEEEEFAFDRKKKEVEAKKAAEEETKKAAEEKSKKSKEKVDAHYEKRERKRREKRENTQEKTIAELLPEMGPNQVLQLLGNFYESTNYTEDVDEAFKELKNSSKKFKGVSDLLNTAGNELIEQGSP